MSKYMVTYDLRKPGQNYDNLIAAIKTYKNAKVTESTWFIAADATASEVHKRLYAHMDSSDRLMVAGLSDAAAWQNCIASDDELQGFYKNN